MNQFWMVWREESTAMHYRHGSEKSATEEAKRLAQLYPNQQFFVVKAIAYAEAVPVNYQILHEIPF